MCGISGFLKTSQQRSNSEQHAKWLADMARVMAHRGPDAEDRYIDEGIGLTHRRLSIIDLSESGTQPMMSGSGRYIISYNGEVYNFMELRKDLEKAGVIFKTHTDTEVILELYEREGADCLTKLNGMYALAIWDKVSKELFLARDRIGKKPLYFYREGEQFAFASEIKSLLQLPFVKKDLRMDAVKDFFAYQYVPDPKTIYNNIYKLKPGHWIKTDGKQFKEVQYWDVKFDQQLPSDLESIKAGLFERIEEATKIRMVSDVPLGAFLSGGVDSSAVVGLMAKNSDGPVTTCAIGFDSKKFDEVDYARQVSELFSTDHREFTVKENVAGKLEEIAQYFDEPFADPSFVPTFFVSQLARREVTVALSGDGGDESFAGYSKYNTDATENRLRALIPEFLRKSVLPKFSSLFGMSNIAAARKAVSLINTLATDPDKGFFMTNCFFRESVWDQLVTGELARETQGYDPSEITRYHYNAAAADDHLSRILYTDLKTYLPGDVLVKVDRMSMANSLEARSPLLDYRVVEYAASIPSSLKLNKKEKKYALKKAFDDFLPENILYRKKMGFSVPLAEWLRKEIYPLANGIFESGSGGLAQCFDMNGVRALWKNHLSGQSQNSQELWSMVAFELWWRAYCGE